MQRSMINIITDPIQKIYLNRHWLNRLPLIEAEKLSTKRLLTYYKKHLHKRYLFLNHYDYQEKDEEYNSYFGTTPNEQFNKYLDSIKAILDKRENV
jgi:hypothetical protein